MASAEELAQYDRNLEIAIGGLSLPRDPVEVALANMVLLQNGELHFPDGEYTFETPPVEVGIFSLLLTTAKVDLQSRSGALAIAAGQKYWDYHMQKSDDISFASAKGSYVAFAEYVRDHREDAALIFAVTYYGMAKSAARHHGLMTEQLDPPIPLSALAIASWQKMMPDTKTKRFGTIHAVYQQTAAFSDFWLPS